MSAGILLFQKMIHYPISLIIEICPVEMLIHYNGFQIYRGNLLDNAFITGPSIRTSFRESCTVRVSPATLKATLSGLEGILAYLDLD